jgi:hypothetical protein
MQSVPDRPCVEKLQPFRPRSTNNSLNHKDFVGILFALVAPLLIITCVVLAISFRTKLTVWVPCAVFAIIIVIAMVIVLVTTPTVVLYPLSTPIVMRHQTPPVFADAVEKFALARTLEEAAPAIQQEYQNFKKLTEDGRGLVATKDTFGTSNVAIGEGGVQENEWRLFNIKLGKQYMPGALDYFPALCAELAKPEASDVVGCVLSILQPGVRIPPHVGYSKSVIRYFLVLDVPSTDPDQCFLCVNGTRYTFQEGKVSVWDDTFPHMVENNTDKTRALVYFDVNRPNLSKFETKLADASKYAFFNSGLVAKQAKVQRRRLVDIGLMTDVSKAKAI